jgi:hypothetical protein
MKKNDTGLSQGSAPHDTEIAKELGVTPEEGKRRLHALMAIENR